MDDGTDLGSQLLQLRQTHKVVQELPHDSAMLVAAQQERKIAVLSTLKATAAFVGGFAFKKLAVVVNLASSIFAIAGEFFKQRQSFKYLRTVSDGDVHYRCEPALARQLVVEA